MMKRIPILLFISLGLSQKEYDLKDIVEQGDIHIKKFSDEIVNGNIYQNFGEHRILLGKMKNGVKEGQWTQWRVNGTKKSMEPYKNGKLAEDN